MKARAVMLYGYKTDIGKIRPDNANKIGIFTYAGLGGSQDARLGVFIVAAGFSEGDTGKKASQLAVQDVMQQMVNALFVAETDQSPDVAGILERAFQAANEAIIAYNTGVNNDDLAVGATMTAVVVMDETAYFAHVGDMRAYLIAPDRIEQLTQDHVVWARHSRCFVLYSALGAETELRRVDTFSRQLAADDALLLCSNGLAARYNEAQLQTWASERNLPIDRVMVHLFGQEDNRVTEPEIKAIVLTASSPQAACEGLIEAANARGGEDNISAIVVKPLTS